VASTVFLSNAFYDGDSSTQDRVMLIAVYSVAAYRSGRWVTAAIGAQVVAYLPLAAVPHTCDIACQLAWTPMFVAAAAAGIAVRHSRRLQDELKVQADLLQRTREERVRLAVANERTRVARDLHDGVAHAVTTMVVHAGAARAMIAVDPVKAQEALEAVHRMGDEALRELGALIDTMGQEPCDPEVHGGTHIDRRPADDQHDVSELVRRSAAAGLRVELVVRGQRRPLVGALELSVYRIVQEALTNVRKHAPGARVWVEVSYKADGVEVDITDTGPSEPGLVVPGAGQGLIGIAERAALFGGRADAAPTAEGGFRIHARLAPDRVAV
jgi:signal transduction histidine kinase